MKRSFLSDSAISAQEFITLLENASLSKINPYYLGKPLVGKSIGLLFEKPSTRTRLSFEVAIHRLGGHSVLLSQNDLQTSRGESLEDTARVFRRYLDGIMGRVKSHSTLETLALYAGIPIINGLSDKYHPCQALADFQTLTENGFTHEDTLVFVGDGSCNVAHSLILATAHYKNRIVLATPPEYLPSPEVLDIVSKMGIRLEIEHDPAKAVAGAKAIYTDVWVSMGQEQSAEEKVKRLQPYQLNSALLSKAGEDCIILHCLPAHKGQEISVDAFEHPKSRIFDQAENRLHAQMALLHFLFTN